MHALVALALVRGIGLGLFHEDPDFSYEPMLREIKATGATHVSLVVSWYQADVGATKIYRHPRFTAPDATVARTIRQARALGLQVMLFPIVRLEHAASPGEWRGTLRPRDERAWWKSYRAFLLDLARLGQSAGATIFCVGSELNSLDARREKWAEVVRAVRGVFRGQLIYSANWDRFAQTDVWHLVDLVGLSAYFELAGGRRDPSVDDLVRAWGPLRAQVLRSSERIGKPLYITEVGYLSQDGTADKPWNEGAQEPIDLEEQRRCYEALARAWRDDAALQGVFFWNWYGWGGPASREYTPRGKPAVKEICKFFGQPPEACPQNFGNNWLR